MVSDKYRCILVHIPKTGGTSICKALGHIENVVHGAQDHRTIQQLSNSVPPEAFDSYFKFAFVRNTWERIASWYKNVIQDPVHRERFGIAHNCSFRDFLTQHNNIWGLQSQLHWIRDSVGDIPLDFLGRFENLQEHFSIVCERIGISDIQLPHLVKAHDTRPYTIIYDDETRSIVAERYAEEIETLGYEFAGVHSTSMRFSFTLPMKRVHGSVDESGVRALANALIDERPIWVKQGSLGSAHAAYLYRCAYQSGADVAAEIGTASGFSTVVLCHALNAASHNGSIGAGFRVASYDIASACLFDKTRTVGDAAREMLSEELIGHVEFHNPASAADLGKFHLPNEIGFLFIDGNHRHPWATLDLLAALPYLASGATVVLHDIHLPKIHPQFDEWGANYLFEGIDVAKDVPSDSLLPNIGCFTVPNDKVSFEKELKQLLRSYKWQVPVREQYLRRLGLANEFGKIDARP